jgi:hypothetical protein
MKKRTKNQLARHSKNLDFFFNRATNEQIEAGKRWYFDVNQFCNELAKEFETTPLTVAQVISALSPRNRWKRNLIDCKAVFQAIKDGKEPHQIKVSTYHCNKFKAFDIAKTGRRIDASAPKTFNFLHNIAHLDKNALTVDVWHIRAVEKKNLKKTPIGTVAYEQIKALTIRRAENIGLAGFEYQAIIWLSAQAFFKNKPLI